MREGDRCWALLLSHQILGTHHSKASVCEARVREESGSFKDGGQRGLSSLVPCPGRVLGGKGTFMGERKSGAGRLDLRHPQGGGGVSLSPSVLSRAPQWGSVNFQG